MGAKNKYVLFFAFVLLGMVVLCLHKRRTPKAEEDDSSALPISEELRDLQTFSLDQKEEEGVGEATNRLLGLYKVAYKKLVDAVEEEVKEDEGPYAENARAYLANGSMDYCNEAVRELASGISREDKDKRKDMLMRRWSECSARDIGRVENSAQSAKDRIRSFNLLLRDNNTRLEFVRDVLLGHGLSTALAEGTGSLCRLVDGGQHICSVTAWHVRSLSKRTEEVEDELEAERDIGGPACKVSSDREADECATTSDLVVYKKPPTDESAFSGSEINVPTTLFGIGIGGILLIYWGISAALYFIWRVVL
jgi:hypothetical protein